jgi:TPR repeat protein
MNRYGALILIVLFGSITVAGQNTEEAQDKKLFQAAQKGDKTALYQLRFRAENGDAYAQVDMALMYSTGTGIKKDSTEAVGWLRRAAEQGDSFAQGLLGEHYALGDGVPKDLVVAYKWLNISAANGDRASGILRDRIENSMTPDQIAEAQRLSRDWKPAR